MTGSNFGGVFVEGSLTPLVVLEGLNEVGEVSGKVWVRGKAALGGAEEGKSVDDE